MDPYIILSGQSKGVNRNKRNRYKSLILAIVKQINQKQLILTQGVDSKKGQLIYLTGKGSFQVILYKMIRFLSMEIKETHETGQNSKNKRFLLTDWSF